MEVKDPRWEFLGGCPKAAPTTENGMDSVAWRPVRHGGPMGARRPRVGPCWGPRLPASSLGDPPWVLTALSDNDAGERDDELAVGGR